MTTSANEQASSSDSGAGAAPSAADSASGAGAEASPKEGAAAAADADDGNDLASKLAAIQEENKSLKERLRGVSKERDDFKKSSRTVEERLAAIEAEAEEGRKLKREKQISKRLSSIVADLPEGNRKLAKSVLKSLQGDGFDFASEESGTVEGKKAALDHLKAEHPELFVAKEETREVNIPRHVKGSNGNGVKVEEMGFPTKDGKRLL